MPATTRAPASRMRLRRLRQPLPSISTSHNRPSPGHTPRVPLSRMARVPSSSPSPVQCQLRSGRQNTTSTINASTTLANTIGCTQAPGRASPPSTWTRARAAAATRPTSAPRQSISRGGCKAQAQAISQGRPNQRLGPSRPCRAPPSRIDTATTSSGTTTAVAASHHRQPISRTAASICRGTSTVVASTSRPNGSRPRGRVSTRAGRHHSAAAAPAWAQRSRVCPGLCSCIASIRRPVPTGASSLPPAEPALSRGPARV